MIGFIKEIRWRKGMVAAWFSVALGVALLAIPFNLIKGPSHDFQIYIGESECVTEGVDPYDVWAGTVQNEQYYPYEHPEYKTETRNKPIHGHTPWSYVYFLPLSGSWPAIYKWCIWQILCVVCLASVLCVAVFYAGRKRWMFVTASALSVGLAIPDAFGGNWIVVVMGALAGMLYCLERKCDVLAGICWAFVVIKPQDGFLIAIPLLLARKWKTLFVTAGICLVTTWISSNLCDKTMIDLLLEVPKLRSGDLDTIHTSAKLRDFKDFCGNGQSMETV